MRHALVRLTASAFLAFTSASAALGEPSTVGLVRANLIRIEDVSPPLKEGEVQLDGQYRMTFRIEKVLAGTATSKTVVETRWSQHPYRGESYVLVREDEGKPKVEWWISTRFGLCFDHDEAKTYGMEEQVRRLQKTDPCRLKHD
jgi:hypothetical protein